MAAAPVNARAFWTTCLVASLTNLAGWTTEAAQGQTTANATPFSRLTIRAGVAWQATDDRLRRFYRPSTGYAAEVAAPFDVGEFALSLERATFTGLAPNPHPDFHGTVGTLRWRMPVNVGPLTIAPGAHAGAMRFSFQDTAIAPGLRKEMELLFGVNAIASLRLPANFSAFVSGEYSHVHLHVPVHIASIAGGLGYSLATPGWLRDFLQ
ncbi:MAG TPA: hypothetical protein VGQ56_11885 [Gemmatimonadaceae bacterium]|jgi:hypothetical protein|nr:hypothetical protein [Gemmatimonadaceae bacterium]